MAIVKITDKPFTESASDEDSLFINSGNSLKQIKKEKLFAETNEKFNLIVDKKQDSILSKDINVSLFQNIAISSSSGVESSSDIRVSTMKPFPSNNGYYFKIDGDYEYRVATYYSSGDFFTMDDDWRQGITQYTGNDRLRRIVFRNKLDPTAPILPQDIVDNLDTNIEELLNITTIESTIQEFNEKFSKIENYNYKEVDLFNKTNFKKGYYLDVNAEEQYLSNGSWNVTYYLDISSSYDKILYYENICNNESTKVVSAFYDKDKNIISSFTQLPGINSIEIPNNAKFVRFSFKQENFEKNTMRIYIIGSITEIISSTDLDNTLYDIQKNEELCLNGYQQGIGGLAYTYWTSPQVIFDDYGYPTDGSGGDYHNEQVFVGTVNKEGATGVATINMHDDLRCKNLMVDETEVDLHDSSSIILDRDDRMLMFSTKHGTSKFIRIFKARKKHDASFFDYIGKIQLPGNVTYSQVFYYNGMYHLFTRVDVNYWYWCSSVDLKNWKYTKLINSSMQYYCLFKETMSEGLLRIVMYSHPNAKDSSIRQGFLNLDTGVLYNSDGITEIGTGPKDYSLFDILISNTETSSQRLLDVVGGLDTTDVRILFTTFTDVNDMQYKVYANGVTTELNYVGKALFENIKVPAGGVFMKNGDILFISVFDKTDNSDHIKRYEYNSVTNSYEFVKDEYIYHSDFKNYRACYLTTDKDSNILVWCEGYFHNQQYFNWNPKLNCKKID